MSVKKMNHKILNKLFVVISLNVLLASCASSTLTTSWVEPEFNKAYKHAMVIAISDSQQTRRIYENHFIDTLEKQGIRATPSYELINSKQKMNRETVQAAISKTDIDAVIVSYLIATDAEVRHHTSPLNQGYSGNVDNNKVSATMISTRGRTSSTEIVTLKTDVYDVASIALMWTAQTRTVAPESIDEVIIDITRLLVNQILEDEVLK